MITNSTARTGEQFASNADSTPQTCCPIGYQQPIIPMKKTIAQSFSLVALGCSVLLYSAIGCSRAPEIPPKEVTIQADDKMRFDLTAFEVKPGQKVSVTIKNVGTTPKFSMGHNFVVFDHTVNTTNVMRFLDAFSTEAAHDYVSPCRQGSAGAFQVTWA